MHWYLRQWSESPVITLDGGMLTVESASQTLSVAIADVADYKFVTKEDIPTAVDKLEAHPDSC